MPFSSIVCESLVIWRKPAYDRVVVGTNFAKMKCRIRSDSFRRKGEEKEGVPVSTNGWSGGKEGNMKESVTSFVVRSLSLLRGTRLVLS